MLCAPFSFSRLTASSSRLVYISWQLYGADEVFYDDAVAAFGVVAQVLDVFGVAVFGRCAHVACGRVLVVYCRKPTLPLFLPAHHSQGSEFEEELDGAHADIVLRCYYYRIVLHLLPSITIRKYVVVSFLLEVVGVEEHDVEVGHGDGGLVEAFSFGVVHVNNNDFVDSHGLQLSFGRDLPGGPPFVRGRARSSADAPAECPCCTPCTELSPSPSDTPRVSPPISRAGVRGGCR